MSEIVGLAIDSVVRKHGKEIGSLLELGVVVGHSDEAPATW